MKKNAEMSSRRPGCGLVIPVVAAMLVLGQPMAFSAPAAAAKAGQVTAEAAAAGEPVSDTITLDFKDADISTVLRVMSMKSGVNIVAGPEVAGNVTVRLQSVPWTKALEVVLRTYGYVYERDGNIIRVTTRENLAQEPTVTKTFILNYSKAVEVQEAVRDMLTERGRIKVADRTNMLVITDIPTNVYSMEEVIRRLDKITPQAFIDSKVIRTDVQTAENLGFEWQTGGAANNLGRLTGASRPTTFPFMQPATEDARQTELLGNFFRQFYPQTGTGTQAITNPEDARFFPLPSPADPLNKNYSYGTLDFSGFAAVLQMLRTKSNTKVVSNPRVVVLNNQTAKIQVGSDIPLPTFERNETTGSVVISGFYYREVGVVLNVTPHINSEEEILVDLTPEISSTGATVDFGDFRVPSFEVTKANTQVLIRSGETIAIGGLLTDAVQMAESKVPYLSSIPLMGQLFRSKRQTAGDSNSKVETLFFVTVTMVDTEGQPAGERVEKKEKAKDQPSFLDEPAKSSGESVATETQSQAKTSNEGQSSSAIEGGNPEAVPQ